MARSLGALSERVDRREPPAALGWRTGARIVDVVVFAWLVAFVVVEIDQRLLGGDPLGTRPGRLALDTGRSVMLAALLAGVYEVMPTAVFGATPGKAVFGLRIRGTAVAAPAAVSSWLAAAVRAALLYGPVLFLGPVGGIVLLVVFVSLAVPASGRGLHDRIAGTIVVASSPDAARSLDDG